NRASSTAPNNRPPSCHRNSNGITNLFHIFWFSYSCRDASKNSCIRRICCTGCHIRAQLRARMLAKYFWVESVEFDGVSHGGSFCEIRSKRALSNMLPLTVVNCAIMSDMPTKRVAPARSLTDQVMDFVRESTLDKTMVTGEWYSVYQV